MMCVLLLSSLVSMAACNHTANKTNMDSTKGKKVLVAYFSRTGENYSVGHITKGNTAIVAEMIAGEMNADLFEIVPQKAYPDNYEACTEVAKREKEVDARPTIKAGKSIADYDVIFIGYPIWWDDAPMPVYTWIEQNKWQGKTVIPFCTHEGSGLSGTPSLIQSACQGAVMGNGLAVYGHVAQRSPEKALESIRKWIGALQMN